jgi:hypothetical protein
VTRAGAETVYTGCRADIGSESLVVFAGDSSTRNAPEPTMIELSRRYRVVADVVVSVRPIDAGKVSGTAPDPQCRTRRPVRFRPKQLEVQQRLLDALVGEESALDAWLQREAVRHVVDSGLEEFQIRTPEEELLLGVIADLPAPDRRYFEAAIQKDVFCEWADPFLDATSAFIVSVTVLEGAGAAQMAPGALAVRAYRVILEAKVQISAISASDAADRWGWIMRRCPVRPKVSPKRFARLQQSLLQALLRCDSVLDHWLKKEVISEIAEYGEVPLVSEPSDGAILHPVLALLSPADRRYFEEALADDVFPERADLLARAIRAETQVVRLAEVRAATPARR